MVGLRKLEKGFLTEGSEFKLIVEGLPAKVALELASTGFKVDLAGAVGDDALGKSLITFLKNNGVNIDNIVVKRGLRTTVVVMINDILKIYFRKPYAITADTEFSLNDISLSRLSNINLLYTSAYALMENPLGHTVFYIVKHLWKNNVKIVLHINFHTYEDRFLSLRELRGILKYSSNIILSYQELDRLLKTSNVKTAAQTIFRKFPAVENVAITTQGRMYVHTKGVGEKVFNIREADESKFAALFIKNIIT